MRGISYEVPESVVGSGAVITADIVDLGIVRAQILHFKYYDKTRPEVIDSGIRAPILSFRI